MVLLFDIEIPPPLAEIQVGPATERSCQDCRYNTGGCALWAGRCLNDPARPEWEPIPKQKEDIL